MAYDNNDMTVLSFQSPGSLIAATDGVVDVSATSADAAVLLIPIPFLIAQFGLFVQETADAATIGSIFLEQSTFAAGTDVIIHEVDLEITDYNSGEDDAGALPTTASITASGGSESMLIAGIIWGASSVFPFLVPAARCLTLRFVQTSAKAGEYTGFVVGNWLGFDFRSTETWASA